MEKMIALAQAILGTELKTNTDGTKLGQIVARTLKANAVDATEEVFENALTEIEGVRIVKVSGKVFIEFDGEVNAPIVLEVDVKVKGLEFDLDEEIAEHEEKERVRIEKEEQKAKEKARKIAEKEAKKAKK